MVILNNIYFIIILILLTNVLLCVFYNTHSYSSRSSEIYLNKNSSLFPFFIFLNNNIQQNPDSKTGDILLIGGIALFLLGVAGYSVYRLYKYFRNSDDKIEDTPIQELKDLPKEFHFDSPATIMPSEEALRGIFHPLTKDSINNYLTEDSVKKGFKKFGEKLLVDSNQLGLSSNLSSFIKNSQVNGSLDLIETFNKSKNFDLKFEVLAHYLGIKPEFLKSPNKKLDGLLVENEVVLNKYFDFNFNPSNPFDAWIIDNFVDSELIMNKIDFVSESILSDLIFFSSKIFLEKLDINILTTFGILCKLLQPNVVSAIYMSTQACMGNFNARLYKSHLFSIRQLISFPYFLSGSMNFISATFKKVLDNFGSIDIINSNQDLSIWFGTLRSSLPDLGRKHLNGLHSYIIGVQGNIFSAIFNFLKLLLIKSHAFLIDIIQAFLTILDAMPGVFRDANIPNLLESVTSEEALGNIKDLKTRLELFHNKLESNSSTIKHMNNVDLTNYIISIWSEFIFFIQKHLFTFLVFLFMIFCAL